MLKRDDDKDLKIPHGSQGMFRLARALHKRSHKVCVGISVFSLKLLFFLHLTFCGFSLLASVNIFTDCEYVSDGEAEGTDSALCQS